MHEVGAGGPLWKAALLGLAVVALHGCAGPSVDLGDTEERDGLVYRLDSNRPFTGIVLTHFADSIAEADPEVLQVRTPVRRGLREGTRISYYASGRKRGALRYEQGVPQGERREWYENGQLSRLQEFADGRTEGTLRAWSEAGQLVLEQGVHGGKAEGLTRTWYPSGERESEAT